MPQLRCGTRTLVQHERGDAGARDDRRAKRRSSPVRAGARVVWTSTMGDATARARFCRDGSRELETADPAASPDDARRLRRLAVVLSIALDAALFLGLRDHARPRASRGGDRHRHRAAAAPSG
ncbi:MAG: hypothetical protein HS111_19745 [Kofleriaceae bacterium]|nr:hypothetical protein [Kofleriaceae bacterium]